MNRYIPLQCERAMPTRNESQSKGNGLGIQLNQKPTSIDNRQGPAPKTSKTNNQVVEKSLLQTKQPKAQHPWEMRKVKMKGTKGTWTKLNLRYEP